MARPVLAAFDIGATTGWAFSCSDGSFRYGSWTLSPKDGHHVRLAEFRSRIDALVTSNSLDLVGVSYEQPFFSKDKLNACRVLYHFEAIILLWAGARRLPVVSYQPTEIKRSLAGGGANKERMVRLVKMLGYNPKNHHEADAIALLRLYLSETERLDLFQAADRRASA